MASEKHDVVSREKAMPKSGENEAFDRAIFWIRTVVGNANQTKQCQDNAVFST